MKALARKASGVAEAAAALTVALPRPAMAVDHDADGSTVRRWACLEADQESEGRANRYDDGN